MKYALLYIILEEKTQTKAYTIERINDGVLKDIDEDILIDHIDEIDNVDMHNNTLVFRKNVVKIIRVYNKNNTGGKLIHGLNDLDTYCRKNNKQEWLDFYNNAKNELSAKDISKSSNKFINIKCTHCGYERRLMLNTFINTQNHACVACQSVNHSKCMTGVNDLYTYCMKNSMEYLLEELDNSIDPRKIGCRSHKKLRWKCSYGHEWDASPDKRVTGRGCPYCKGSQTSKTERAICNWLKENSITIIERGKLGGEEFDINIVDYNILIEFNSDATHFTADKIEKDAKKREIANRLNKKLIVVMQSCFSYFNDELYYDLVFKSDKKDYLKDLIEKLSIILESYGLSIHNTVTNKAIALANKNEVPFERSLLGVYTDIEQYWSDKNEVSPALIYANSRRYIYLKCDRHNNEYSVRADSLAYTYDNSRGCQYCAGKLPVKGETDLLTLEKELCKDWNDMNIQPDEVTIHSNKYVNWKCQFCGHKWKAMINNRTGVNRTGCPNCGQKISR